MINWTEAGAGECLVLLHGLGGDVGFWENETAALAPYFRVIAIDLRGSGSTPSTRGFTIADLADDVRIVLDEADVDTAHVVGFSLGGLVAQEFALRHPKRLKRLVLASTYAVMNTQARLFLDAVLDVYQKGATPKQMFDLISPWLFSTPFVNDPSNAAYFELPDDAADDQSMEDWRELYRAQQRFDSTSRLHDIRCPTLVIAGGVDHLVSAADSETLRDHIGHAEIATFAASGHLTNVEEADRFIATVREFLGR
jgi:pimeloyl-ACP methyl ester carboxylesterase